MERNASNLQNQVEQTFDLSLSSEEFLAYYRGNVRWVQVTAKNGCNLKFPANFLSPFVTRSGVHGRFLLTHTKDGKFINLRRIEE